MTIAPTSAGSVAMLSSVLHSERAVQVNIEIMRAFVRLRRMLQANAELALQLEALERKYDHQFSVRIMNSQTKSMKWEFMKLAPTSAGSSH